LNKILITRPKKEAKILAKKLENIGYETVIESLFSIKKESPKKFYKNPQAIIITSSNACSFLKKLNLAKNTLILTVGENTRNASMKLGFNNIISANNSATSLYNLALKTLSSKKGLIIYLSGEIITIDIAKKLEKKGFKAIRLIAYKTVRKIKLSNSLIDQIKNNQINLAVIYSKETATTFYKLLLKHNLLEYFIKIKLLCLSKNIALYCKKLGFKKTELIFQIIKDND